MKNLFLLLIALFSLNATAKNRPHIVVTVGPIASIISMLTTDMIDIDVIASNNGCPHNYHLKPSDFQKIKKADLLIYVDEDFDSFITKFILHGDVNTLRLSDIRSLDLISTDNRKTQNWHIWLSLDNVEILLSELTEHLRKQFPEMRDKLHINLQAALENISNLRQIKLKKLSEITDVILLSDSLEHFFSDQKEMKIFKLLNSKQKTIKYRANIQSLLYKSNSKCMIISQSENISFYKDFDANILQVEDENWDVTNLNANLFSSQYLKIIDKILQCKQSLDKSI